MKERTAPLVLEIARREDTLSMAVSQQEQFLSTLRHFTHLRFSPEQVNAVSQEIVSFFRRAERSSPEYSGLSENLRKAGQLLWDQLFTRTVKEKLKVCKGADLILCLDEELVNIPWELLYDGQDFLCLAFNTGRVIKTRQQITSPRYRSISSHLRMLILANPTDDLRCAYQEGLSIRNQFDRKRKAVSIDFKSTHIDTLYVKKNLRDYDIVHFAGHCEHDRAEPSKSGWVLEDGMLSAEDIYALAETLELPSLIFSNACGCSAFPESHLQADAQEKAYGVASAFLFSGVRHYIGSLFRIEDNAALHFAKEFYRQLLSGKPIGECLRSARLGLVQEYGLESTWWARYLLYGDPSFAFFRPRPKAAEKKTKVFLRICKTPLCRFVAAGAVLSLIFYLAYAWLPTVNPNTYFSYRQSRAFFSQGRNKDAIDLALSVLRREPSYGPAYPLLAQAYERQGDRENALKYYFEYALLCERNNDAINLSFAYIEIGWIYHLKGSYAKARDFYEKALLLSREKADTLHEAQALRKLAVLHIDKEQYDRALELLLKSSEINREHKNNRQHQYNLACDYFDIGLVFSNKDDYFSAVEFYNKSSRIFQKLGLTHELSDYYFNLGEIYLLEKEYQKALASYMQGLKIDEANGNMPSMAADYNMIGELYMEMDNLKEAERFFMRAREVSGQIDAPLELAGSNYNLGLLHKQLNRKNRAREYLRQAQIIYAQMKMPGEYEQAKEQLLSLDNF